MFRQKFVFLVINCWILPSIICIKAFHLKDEIYILQNESSGLSTVFLTHFYWYFSLFNTVWKAGQFFLKCLVLHRLYWKTFKIFQIFSAARWIIVSSQWIWMYSISLICFEVLHSNDILLYSDLFSFKYQSLLNDIWFYFKYQTLSFSKLSFRLTKWRDFGVFIVLKNS